MKTSGIALLKARQRVKALVNVIESPWRRFGAFYRTSTDQVNISSSLAAWWWLLWVCVVGVPMLLKTMQSRLSVILPRKWTTREQNPSVSPLWKRWSDLCGAFSHRQKNNRP
jgi:hypothetical protein